jgi:hypothetical protein
MSGCATVLRYTVCLAGDMRLQRGADRNKPGCSRIKPPDDHLGVDPGTGAGRLHTVRILCHEASGAGANAKPKSRCTALGVFAPKCCRQDGSKKSTKSNAAQLRGDGKRTFVAAKQACVRRRKPRRTNATHQRAHINEHISTRQIKVPGQPLVHPRPHCQPRSLW